MLSNHQHNPSFCLDKHIREATDNGINLVGSDGLSVLADVEALSVDHLGNLLGAHSSVLTYEAVKYGFFYFHK